MASLILTWNDGALCECTFEYESNPDDGLYHLSGEGAQQVQELIDRESGMLSSMSPWSGFVDTPASWYWLRARLNWLVRLGHASSLEIIDPPPLPPHEEDIF